MVIFSMKPSDLEITMFGPQPLYNSCHQDKCHLIRFLCSKIWQLSQQTKTTQLCQSHLWVVFWVREPCQSQCQDTMEHKSVIRDLGPSNSPLSRFCLSIIIWASGRQQAPMVSATCEGAIDLRTAQLAFLIFIAQG